MQDYQRTTEYSLSQEAEENLVGFFDVLLQVDRRVNPENYQPKETQTNDYEKDSKTITE
jgi:hypothetical protein